MKHHASKKPADKRQHKPEVVASKTGPADTGAARSGATTAASGEAKVPQKGAPHRA
ncbi:hypothetical protein [Roseateles sp.]|uniref:hypothetical protein n=1 Tax=Roseateles sp. TaxID=1971397 RepID=UPI003266E5DF